MPFGAYSVGRDVTLTLYGQLGGVVNLNQVTEFESSQDTHAIQIKSLDGVVKHLQLPNGWKGKFELTRASDEIDSHFAQLESSYYAGQNVGYATITETITNPDGSSSQYQYTGVMLKLANAGQWKGDSEVKQSLEFVASKRLKVT